MERSKTILIVDDDIDLCILLANRLKNYHMVKIVHTLHDARHMMTTFPPDILFLDNNLPDGVGFDLLVEIRSRGSLPVVMMTADHSITLKTEAEKLGVRSFLWKPFKVNDIVTLIDEPKYKE